MKHFNELTPAEAERLALLSEEMGEAAQAIGKILRHGYESRSPLLPGSPTNRETLEREVGDVLCAMNLLTKAHDLDMAKIKEAKQGKEERVGRWLHHQTPSLQLPVYDGQCQCGHRRLVRYKNALFCEKCNKFNKALYSDWKFRETSQ
jgi:NTP pyrophosphatase (non-canonical NTP hydrolase)